MSSKQEHPIQAMGFWLFGSLSVVLAVLKLTVAGYWSWWRVMLPFLAFLGHNAVYLLAGFLCFCWLKHEEDEEEPTAVQKHSRAGYNLAALLFFFLFLDNLLRRAEGQGWKGFWPCSGRLEVVVLFGMLSLVAQFVYRSRIVSGLNLCVPFQDRSRRRRFGQASPDRSWRRKNPHHRCGRRTPALCFRCTSQTQCFSRTGEHR